MNQYILKYQQKIQRAEDKYAQMMETRFLADNDELAIAFAKDYLKERISDFGSVYQFTPLELMKVETIAVSNELAI